MHDPLYQFPLDPSATGPYKARFDVQRTLGQGGMGIVLDAIDRTVNTRVAVKLLPGTDAQGVYLFKREFRSLARIVHPNLVQLFELIAHEDAWAFTMELVDGVDFRTWVRPQEQLDLPRVLSATWQIVEGIAALHAAGVLHRDLKPPNVLVTRDGSVKVLDFGLAQSLDADVMPGEGTWGTLPYMSPEQLSNEPLSPASDLYAIGAMLVEVLSGEVPFTGTPTRVLADKLALVVPALDKLPDTVPPELAQLCEALLDPEPSARPSAAQLLQTLERLGGRPAPGVKAEHTTPVGSTAVLPRVSFVGRSEELSILSTAASEARAGRMCVMSVRGRSGSGKSTLVTQFLDRLRDDDVLILGGRCYEQESVPYKGIDSVMDALTRHLLRQSDADVEALLPENIGLLAQLFPVLQRVERVEEAARWAIAIPDRRERRRQAFMALRTVLERLARQRLLVLSIDDLQWGDADSGILLRDVLEPLQQLPLLVLLAYRKEYEDTSACLRLLLASERLQLSRRVLEVGPLTESDAEDLARQLLGSGAASTQAARIASESAGNPYYVSELCRSLIESSASGATPERALLSLDEVLFSRVERLNTPERELIDLLSISARPLRLRHVRDAISAGQFGPQLVSGLRAAQLVRSTGPTLEDELEVYHDRVREAVAQRMPQEQQRQCHERLARTFEHDRRVDAETVAVHFSGAGHTQEASVHYERAAEGALQALAFDRAAKLFATALALRSADGTSEVPLRVQLGHALANAGRCAEAGDAFLAAARALPEGTERTDLLRLSATQYCTAGRVGEGRSIFREAMRQAGLTLPNPGLGILPSLLLRRARVEMSNLESARQAAGEGTPAERARIDMLWSVSTSLSGVDHVGVASLQALALLTALDAREPQRLARCLSWEAVLRASGGADNAPVVQRLLDVAGGLADRIGEAHALGMVQLARAWSAFLQGNFPLALTHALPAVETFRERCTGVAWELVMAETAISWAHVHMGNTAGVRESIADYYGDGVERGNLTLITNFLSVAQPFVALAEDDPAACGAHLDEALALWPHEGYHVQHVSLLWGWSRLHLYRGEPEASLARYDREWAPMRNALHLRGQLTRVTALDSRGRSALAVATTSSARRPPLVKRALDSAAALRKEGEAWVTPYADRLFGLVAQHEGNEREAIARLDASWRGFARSGARLDSAATRRRCGQIMGGDAGRDEVQAADAEMRALGITNVEAMTRMLTTP